MLPELVLVPRGVPWLCSFSAGGAIALWRGFSSLCALTCDQEHGAGDRSQSPKRAPGMEYARSTRGGERCIFLRKRQPKR